ncbi:MAG: hypothetical protein JSR33_06430 [Proteobacteria bacterium]|nr:hypothetical protein [Pseudomonadota bacterium]
MQQGNALYILQSELIDKKVEISVNNNLAAVNSTLLRLGEQITDLRYEMLREMGYLWEEIHKIEIRLTVVETHLGIRLQNQADLRHRFLDFSFKLGWVALFAILTTAFTLFSKMIH